MGTTCSRDGTLSTDSNLESHNENPAFPDIEFAAELLLDLSVFGFRQLSENDQHEKMQEICKKILPCGLVEQLPEESEEEFKIRKFKELFRKLYFPEQNLFLSRVIKKFKRERQFGELISWFKKLDANRQQKELEMFVHVTAEETNKDLRLERFRQISRDYTDYVHKRIFGRFYIRRWKNNDKSRKWLQVKTRFSEFFSGFSIIWFQGQCANDQRALIELLSRRVKGVKIETLVEYNQHFRLKKFTELCKKVVDFHIQVEVLDKAEKKLCQWTYLPHRLFLEPQDSGSAADLLSRVSAFGFGLLSPNDQLEKIEKYRSKNFAVKGVTMERLAEESEEDFRMRKFTKQYNEVYKWHQIRLFLEFKEKFSHERHLCESIILFRQLCPSEQEELMEELTDRLWEYTLEATKETMIQKLSKESEEDFKFRRFIKLCCVNPSLRDLFVRSEAEKWDLNGMLQTSVYEGIVHDIQRHSRYAEFLYGVSIIWFQTVCSNDPRNPIQLLHSGDIVEKLANESEDEFRVRRFTESFKKLPFISQEYLVNYIQDAVLRDIGPVEAPCGASIPEGRSLFDLEFIKVKAPNLRGEGGATTEAVRGTTTQGGEATTGGAVTSSST